VSMKIRLRRSRTAPDTTWLCQGWVLQFEGAEAAVVKTCSSVAAATGSGRNPRIERREQAIWSNIRADSRAPDSSFMERLLVKFYEDHLYYNNRVITKEYTYYRKADISERQRAMLDSAHQRRVLPDGQNTQRETIT
jgi:hypothetical protein